MQRNGKLTEALVTLDVGGTGLSLARNNGVHLSITLDAEEDSNFHAGNETVRVQLPAESMDKLRNAPDPATRAFFTSHPGQTRSGGGGNRIAGYMLHNLGPGHSPKRYTRREKVVAKLVRNFGGRSISQVVIRVRMSLAGAVGSGAGPAEAKQLGIELQRRLNIPVLIEMHAVGPHTFQGLAHSPDENTAGAVAELFALAQGPDRCEGVDFSLLLREVPNVREDKRQRTELFRLLSQAEEAPVISKFLRDERINHACDPNSEVGSTILGQPKYWHPLAAAAIAPSIASGYLPELQALLKLPTRPDDVTSLQVAYDSRQAIPNVPTVQECLESLMYDQDEGIHRLEAPDEWGKTDRTFNRVGVECVLSGFGKVLIAPGDAQFDYLTATQLTPSRIRKHLSLLLPLQAALQEEVAAWEERLNSSKGQRTRALGDGAQSIRRFIPRGMQIVRAWFVGIPSEGEMREEIKGLRDLSNNIAKAALGLQALRSALHHVTSAIGETHKSVNQLMSMLRETLLGREGEPPLVRPLPLEETLPGLLSAAKSSNEEVVRDRLFGAVREVTIHGLAATIGAQEATYASIADQLVRSAPPTPAPPWGGHPRLPEGSRFLVLPPTRRADLEELQMHLRAEDYEPVITTTTSAMAGVCAMELEFVLPKSVDDLFSPRLRAALDRAVEQKHLFLTDIVPFRHPFASTNGSSSSHSTNGSNSNEVQS